VRCDDALLPGVVHRYGQLRLQATMSEQAFKNVTVLKGTGR